ncbi:MAG: oligopeptide transport system permease protein [Hyphomonadaceae bacterium]|nr:MAG: oligopeptide transport system permease protein [Hyphomonadaceae bacterium]KAF0185994.1 MAG: oligopeptide transport system permease protein [Hyphomonadaceae bacterium]
MSLPPLHSPNAAVMEKSAVIGRSLWADARARLFRNKAAVISMYVLAFLVIIAIFGPLLWVHKFDKIYIDRVLNPPSWSDMHPFGNDPQGRDLFVRLLYGLRISLAVGVVATTVSLTIGVLWGATAGYLGGKIDQIMMRIVDILYALPFIFFVIILMVVFGRNIFLIFLAIGAVEWLTMARIVRGQTLSLRKKEYIEAAQAAGLSTFDIITKHIVPNLLGPVVVYVTLTIPAVILQESLLSFLGLGVQEPMTSLGNLISIGAKEMEIAPWLLIFPAAAMMITLFCLNFIGDGLRDAIDPKDR